MSTTRPRSILESDPPTVACRYQCDACGVRDREVKVPAREVGQNIIWWLDNRARPLIAADHFATSPHCRTPTMTWVKIPIGDDDLIGAIQRQ